MNHFSYEVMGKEKVKGFQEEGMRNQEVHRSSISRSLLPGLPKLVLIVLSLLGVLSWLVR